MEGRKKISWILINLGCLAALLLVVAPLLAVGRYNYPSADDWSYGVGGYRILQSGGNIWDVIVQAFKVTIENHTKWEGRFSNVFLAALQPGIWGEKCYGIVVWILLGSVVISEVILCKYFLCSREHQEQNRWYWLPVILPVVILQILYTPAIVESFYWYVGGINYTFMYAMSLILLVLFLMLSRVELSGWKRILTIVSSCILAVLIGGNNFATSLACLLSMCVLEAVYLFIDRKKAVRTCFLPLLVGISLLICIFAPANATRINGNFGGETTGSAIGAVAASLVRSFLNIYSWTNVKVILVLVFTFPFVWKCVKNMNFSFKLPGLFTFLSFGLYASQCTATMYVDGTTGGGRMAAILYYSCLLWVIGNFIYWMGWLARRQNKIQKALEKAGALTGKYILPYCAIIGIVLCGVIYTCDLKELSSYKAYRDLRQGWAKQYAAEWDARLEILHDDTVEEVELKPLSVYPETIQYTDLQPEDGYLWVNRDCAKYYGKKSIMVIADN